MLLQIPLILFEKKMKVFFYYFILFYKENNDIFSTKAQVLETVFFGLV